MPHTRHAAPRCRSIPNQQIGSSAGTPQREDIYLHQNEPIANIELSSQDEVQAVPAVQPKTAVAEGSSAVQRKAPTYWTVNIINEEGHITQTCLRVQDVFSMHNATRVLIKWNSKGQPVGESAGLLLEFLGDIASNFDKFPIMYENWKKVPPDYKNNVYNTNVKTKFVVNDGDNKKYILASLGIKWRDNRCRLFNRNYNWEFSFEQNCQIHPEHIDPDHWTMFLHYKLSPKTMAIIDKNAANREKQLIPHTLGSKTLARKRVELEMQSGRHCGRGDMYQIAHKKRDGSFVNDEEQLHNENHESSSGNETFVKVFGKEDPRYIQDMRLGVMPSHVIGSSSHSTRLTFSSEVNAKIEKMQYEIDLLKAQVAEIEVLKQQVAFLLQNANGNQVTNLESPRDVSSSKSSYVRLNIMEYRHERPFK